MSSSLPPPPPPQSLPLPPPPTPQALSLSHSPFAPRSLFNVVLHASLSPLCAIPVDARSLLHEAAALQQLQHPHVVRVFGVVVQPSMAVVMEFVSLGPLSRYVCWTQQCP